MAGDFDLRGYQAGQVLTRELINAEAKFQAAKKECQDLAVDITYDDNLSSGFPSLSQDGLIISDGVWGEEHRVRRVPGIIEWCRTLPTLIEGIIADQESWTFVPSCDNFFNDAESLRDFDSVSMQEGGKKRKRIDTVMDDNEELRDAAVNHWARTQKRSKTLFHQTDGFRVHAKERK